MAMDVYQVCRQGAASPSAFPDPKTSSVLGVGELQLEWRSYCTAGTVCVACRLDGVQRCLIGDSRIESSR